MTSADKQNVSKGDCELESEDASNIPIRLDKASVQEASNISSRVDTGSLQEAKGARKGSDPLQTNFICFTETSTLSKENLKHQDFSSHSRFEVLKPFPRFPSCELKSSSCKTEGDSFVKDGTKKRAHSVPSELLLKDISACRLLLDSNENNNHAEQGKVRLNLISVSGSEAPKLENGEVSPCSDVDAENNEASSKLDSAFLLIDVPDSEQPDLKDGEASICPESDDKNSKDSPSLGNSFHFIKVTNLGQPELKEGESSTCPALDVENSRVSPKLNSYFHLENVSISEQPELMNNEVLTCPKLDVKNNVARPEFCHSFHLGTVSNPEQLELKNSGDSTCPELDVGEIEVSPELELCSETLSNGAKDSKRGNSFHLENVSNSVQPELKNSKAQSCPELDVENNKPSPELEICCQTTSKDASISARDNLLHLISVSNPEQPELKNGEAQSCPELDVENAKANQKSEICSKTISDETSISERGAKKPKKSQSIKKSLSDRVKRKDVIQNFKGFFDSMSRKKHKNSFQDKEHIYDEVEIRPECSFTSQIQLPTAALDSLASSCKSLSNKMNNDNSHTGQEVESNGSDFIRESKVRMENCVAEASSAYSDPSPPNQVKEAAETLPSVKVKPPVPEKPNKTFSKSPSHHIVCEKKSPSSLYNTCCMHIACLLKDKAASKVSKSPPPIKPPKPSAEVIAKARAAAVCRRLENAQKASQSIGETCPLGCAGFRFVDDDTESSCDYKDIDSYDYMVDYELIHKPESDNKLDSFSVPSICSSVTSYHTADEDNTLNESFSDCVSEMQNDVPLHADGKSSEITTQVRKVPPPVPPKPAISKLKTIPNKDMLPSVNGFSSLKSHPKRDAKNQNEILKRPLVVADIRKTQFSSLPHTKIKGSPQKPLRHLTEAKSVKSPPRPPPPSFLKPKCVEPAERTENCDSDKVGVSVIKPSEEVSENLADPPSLSNRVCIKITDDLVSCTKDEFGRVDKSDSRRLPGVNGVTETLPSENPKPPPRTRRVRSRTAEVFALKKEPERLRRSQSLSDLDVESRVASLNPPQSNCYFKSLYSAVNKNGAPKGPVLSTPELVSGRPLPAPPPPPRKFRSLERQKCKENKPEEDKKPASSYPIRPNKSSEKKGYSQDNAANKNRTVNSDSKSSLPFQSEVSRNYNVDLNANFSSPVSNLDSHSISGQVTPEPERRRSRSSWYDEYVNSNESSHLSGNPKPPVRKRAESKPKRRESSKFYVPIDQEQEEVSHADKETSPLPVHCSEKSVQTSLETLSHRESSPNIEAEDSDELLNLAQSLQAELSTIIARHSDEGKDKFRRSLSANLEDSEKEEALPLSSSEAWPSTSSGESDAEKDSSEEAASKKRKKSFLIAQEIMGSEEVFVDALRLLTVDFKATVEAANQQLPFPVIPEELLAQIFNHLPQLLHLNENLLIELKDRIQNWEKIEKIADIIVKMGPFLKLYSWYICDFEPNVALFEECKRKYFSFCQVVKDFEASPRCKRLTLNHYMLKPIQRIPQYRLLLQEYLNHLSEDSKDYQDTVAALQIVSEVANHANQTLKQGDNAQKLISIQNSIIGHKEIVKPGRIFVKEGELMKLSRKGMQPRWFILFNDLLLYLTPVQPGLYRLNHDLPLTGMKVAIPIQQDYQNEFSIISVKRSFTLAARSSDERQEWIVALTKGIEENALKRSTFMLPCLVQKAQDKLSSEDESAFVLGKKAPVWIPDARVTMCQLCTSEFTVTFRRHHCRACGKVVCSICSSHRLPLPYLNHRVARVCDDCHNNLGQKSSPCSESGETDSENQQIAVKPHLRADARQVKKNRRFLPSVLKEVCANDQGSTISGYLYKKVGKGWKRDWFVLKDKVLYEYKASEDVAALRSTPLLGYQVSSFKEPYEGIDSSLLFQLTHPGQSPMVFYSETDSSTKRWMLAVKEATYLE